MVDNADLIPTLEQQKEENTLDYTEIPLFDRSNPRSLINLLPEKTAEAFERVPEEFLLMDAKELKKLVYPELKKRGRAKLTPKEGKAIEKSTFDTDERIRHSFWLEYDAAQASKRKMYANNFYGGIVTLGQWYGQITTNPKRMAWFLTPPGSYRANILSLLDKTTARLHEIVDLPLVVQVCKCRYMCQKRINQQTILKGSKEGKKETREELGMMDKYDVPCKRCPCEAGCTCPAEADAKLAAVIEKIHTGVELRAKGAIPMRIDERRIALNYNKTVIENKTAGSTKLLPSQEEIDRELKKLRAEAEAAQNDIIEVEIIESPKEK